MHEDIMDWSSKHFYLGKLYAAETVAKHKLSELPGVTNNPMTNIVLKLYDSKGQEGFEEISNNSKTGPSFANVSEAAIVVDCIEKLITNGLSADKIAVIAPYNYQVLEFMMRRC